MCRAWACVRIECVIRCPSDSNAFEQCCVRISLPYQKLEDKSSKSNSWSFFQSNSSFLSSYMSRSRLSEMLSTCMSSIKRRYTVDTQSRRLATSVTTIAIDRYDKASNIACFFGPNDTFVIIIINFALSARWVWPSDVWPSDVWFLNYRRRMRRGNVFSRI